MSTALSAVPRPPVARNHRATAAESATDAVGPSPARLTLTPRGHDGGLDGAWWPRTRQPAYELRALVAGLERELDPITRLSLSGTTWDSTPDTVRVDDHEVLLIWFSRRDPHTVIVGYGADEITLLIVPQDATPGSGAWAMRMACDPHNTADPAGILQASRTQSWAAGRLPAYAQEAHAYDRHTRAFDNFRGAIVDALPLQPGQVVLDVGCGTGLCFASLLDRVGPHGTVVGIDASPEMVQVARQRTTRAGWGNVTLVQSPVHDAQIPVTADAALFCAVHDIMRSPDALRRVLDGLRPGAWVAAGGGKWTAPWMVALNWQVRALHAPYVESFEGFARPWSHLERLIRDVRVRELAFGSGYVLTGRVPGR